MCVGDVNRDLPDAIPGEEERGYEELPDDRGGCRRALRPPGGRAGRRVEREKGGWELEMCVMQR